MSIEERRALLGDIEPTQVRESSNARVAIVFALLAAGGIGASAWLWTRLDSERESLREAEAKLAAESAARAAESADAARRLSAAEADLGAARASAKEAEEARIRNEKAADALIASFLRSSQVELGGSSTGLAREILRGGGLDEMSRTLPEGKYLAVALAVIESLAREPSAGNTAELYRDLTFAADFAARAKAAIDPSSPTYGDALHAVAQFMWAARRLPFVEEKVATALRGDAAKFAAAALEARRSAGGRRFAVTLVLLAEFEREAKRLDDAAKLLAEADLEVLKDGSEPEKAAVELALAEVLFEIGRAQQAVETLEARARSVERFNERELAAAPAIALRLRETRMKMLDAMGVPKAEPQRWMLEQVALARAQFAARRYAAVYESMPAILKGYERDQSRFRERLECVLLLARSMDALGSPKAALETLDQRQFVDDARVLGAEQPLAKDYESLRAELRARRE